MLCKVPLLCVQIYLKNGMKELSKREQEVALLLAEGFTMTQIAEKLGLKKGTIQNYRERIYLKLDVSSITELYNYIQDNKENTT